ncbi:hypothetical protein [Exiguobacterium sp. s21]|uniref:hypothetical protein n=1 Tax=Exiguobacterium sp. s21 TaxID=2751244 RepID=UPI001BEACE97|nr:hypothetical protein [Exiguobacterium sp. s21]
MNLDRYEKIDGWQALERLKDGKVVFSFHNNEFSEFVIAAGDLYSSPVSTHAQQRTPRLMTIDRILRRDWYIPKPFDVRQAMRDKPDEWVGVYEDIDGRLYKVGFDSRAFTAVIATYKADVKVDLSLGGCSKADIYVMDNCIPIEDVPKEATR